jgi:hypothetical protein
MGYLARDVSSTMLGVWEDISGKPPAGEKISSRVALDGFGDF